MHRIPGYADGITDGLEDEVMSLTVLPDCRRPNHQKVRIHKPSSADAVGSRCGKTRAYQANARNRFASSFDRSLDAAAPPKVQSDSRGVLRGNRFHERADFERRQIPTARILRFARAIDSLKVARKSTFRAFIAVLHFQDTHVQFRVAIASKAQGAYDLNKSNHVFALPIVDNARASADDHAIALGWHTSRLPRFRIRPVSVGDGFQIEVNMGVRMWFFSAEGRSGGCSQDD